MGWRYLAFSAPGGEFLGELPTLSEVEVTRSLSGPGRLTGTVPLEVEELRSMLRPWQVSIWAEAEGQIRGGGLLTPPSYSASSAKVDCVGLAGYPQGMPWTAEPFSGVRVDPLAVVRMIWGHLQSQPGGDLGVSVDATTSPIRVGEPERDVAFTTGDGQDVAFTTGPYTLNHWSSHDLGKAIDDLAIQTPFDYREHTELVGEHLTHRLELGYPTLGGRRENLRFALGENVSAIPDLSGADEDYASEVHALGAGEGRTMVRASLTRPTLGVRRVLTFTDKSARSATALTESARAELAWRDGEATLTDLEVIDHPHAPLGSFDVGDQIHVTGSTGWVDLDRWVRIVALRIRPEIDRVGLTVVEV